MSCMSVEFIDDDVLDCLACWLPAASLNGLCVVLTKVFGYKLCRLGGCVVAGFVVNGDGVGEVGV